ncbi:hypothetical protein SCOCK_10001 [Actinacidiphila cocklensis]|uniref:Uncharacterized protein n=1 Tax=Actinacidiphila cocklensis TaxID=887465 RepID=A0A9W4DIA6_9ACTN|nr:hypothetical protein [Actinacidiphila cocklensis]CAG6390533.1 hypothetical protein SCOCK_10001 [Actinacidiphila cocklensis]
MTRSFARAPGGCSPGGLEAEVDQYIAELAAETDGGGRHLVVRNGHHRPRTTVARGAGSPAAALAMVFKLVETAQARCRAVTGAHPVALVRAGATFENGVLVERGQATAA